MIDGRGATRARLLQGVADVFYSLLPGRIHLLRHLHDMTQERLAEALGTTCESISEWERGKSRISLHYVLRLADVFDLPITVFFPPLEEWHPAPQASVCASSPFRAHAMTLRCGRRHN
jgi:transcriptional regulator with XRE-family HTH domain